MDSASATVMTRLSSLAALIGDHEKWSTEADVYSAVLALQTCLEQVADAQEGLPHVDDSMPFDEKAERLQSWLRSHPFVNAKGIKLVDNLGVERGERGGVATEPITKGESLMSLPVDLAISTESGEKSRELGPLLEHPGLVSLRQMPVVILSLHLMIENAKCLWASGVRPGSAGAPAGETANMSFSAGIPPANVSTGRTSEDVFKDKREGRDLMNQMLSNPGAFEARGGPPVKSTALAVDGKPGSHPWGSKWRAYIALLPKTVSNCMYWRAADWAAVRGTAAFLSSAMHLRNSAQLYLKMHRAFVQEDRVAGFAPYFTWAHFRWAQAMVMSRQNRMPAPVGGMMLGLIPLFDMLNHAPDAPEFTATATMTRPRELLNAGAEGASGAAEQLVVALELKAYRDFAPGEEVTHSYGTRPGSWLLQYQGFVSAETLGPLRDEGVPVTAQLAEGEDPLLRVRANALQASEITPVQFGSPQQMAAGPRLREELASKARANSGTAHEVAELLQMLEETPTADLVAQFVPDAVRWRWPLIFPVPHSYDSEFSKAQQSAVQAPPREDGKPVLPLPDGALYPQALLQFCRVACMDKVDAAPVLRLMQQHSVKAKEAAAAAGHGHSHSDGSHCHGHGDPGADIGPMYIPALRPESESRARAMASGLIQAAMDGLDAWKGTPQGMSPGAVPEAVLKQYRASQRRMLEQALDELKA